MKAAFRVLSSQCWPLKLLLFSISLAVVYLFVSLNTCSSGATQADIPLPGQRRHPEQQEERTWIHSGLCAGYSWCVQARVQVSERWVFWTQRCLPLLEIMNEWMIAFILVSNSGMVRRTVENSLAGFCPSGRRELCTTAACWINCRRFSVSCRSVNGPGPSGCTIQRQIQSEMAGKTRRKNTISCVWGDFSNEALWLSLCQQMERRRLRRGSMRRSSQTLRTLPLRVRQRSPHRCCTGSFCGPPTTNDPRFTVHDWCQSSQCNNHQPEFHWADITVTLFTSVVEFNMRFCRLKFSTVFNRKETDLELLVYDIDFITVLQMLIAP